MANIWNRILAPQGGPQKSLLKKDGPTSDRFEDGDDDDSSSLSGRRAGSRPVTRKKLFTKRKLFRRKTTVGGDDDGYDSDASSASKESTRSTSSSFLSYQNRAKWKAFFTGKNVVQRGNDGSELPVLNAPSNPWPMFDRIYKRQNQILNKGEAGEDGKAESSDDDDDDDSDSPPVPIADHSDLAEDVVDECVEIDVNIPSGGNGKCVPPQNDALDSSAISTQESGASTCERSKDGESYPPVSANSDCFRGSASQADVIMRTDSIKENLIALHLKARNSKQMAEKRTGDILTPLSIPRTICYSLRSAIGDGSARQRNSHNLMERRVLRPNGSHVHTSYWSHRGKRSYMEDRFVIERIGLSSKQPLTWLAVFDGHGGAAASQFCSDWLSSYVRKNEFFPNQLPLAMKFAFTKLDSDFVSSGNLDGSTACACIVVGHERVICCNAGDSRAIIIKRDGSVVALSEDHKPGRNDETKRINDLGGRVIYWGRWRVEGVLAVSRSIGDAKLKPYVTAEPDIVEHDIGEDDMFLVIASDGVWDTMSSDLVAKFVLVNTCKIINKSLKVDDTLLRWIARQISKRARENGSSDNVSCIVANLKRK